jgi:quercetin dioxygenase-like cupin family protein
MTHITGQARILSVSRLRALVHLTPRRTSTRSIAYLLIAAVATAMVAAVRATPATGTLSSTAWARATFVDPVDIKFKIDDGQQEVIHVTDSQDVLIQQVVLAPGGQSGWHSHPGPVIVLVKAGRLTFYDGESPECATRTYSAGQAFIDRGQGHVHLARNLSTTDNAEMWFTYVDVPPGAGARIDAPDPGTCFF